MGYVCRERKLRFVTLSLSLVACSSGAAPSAEVAAPAKEPAVPFVSVPAPFVRDIAVSEDAAKAVGRSAGAALCETLSTGSPTPVAAALTADFAGRWVGRPGEALGDPGVVRVVRMGPDPSVLEAKAFERALARHAAHFAVVEDCRAKIVHFKLAPSRDRAFARLDLRIAGLLTGGVAASQRGTLGTEVVLVATDRWAFRRVEADTITEVAQDGMRFFDASSLVGVGLYREAIAEESQTALVDRRARQNTGGIAVLDWDRDGRPDLLSWNRRRDFVLFRNDGAGGFVRRIDLMPTHLVGWFHVVVDLDGDGVEEVVSTEVAACREGQARLALFRRRGDRLVAVPAGLPFQAPCMAYDRLDYQHVAPLDIDGDGDLDLFVAGHRNARSNSGQHNHLAATDGERNLLFVNQGGLRFTEEGVSRDLVGRSWSYVGQPHDFDGDGDVDLLVANDYGPNELYDNVGGGRFRPIRRPPLTDVGESMGVTVADFDGDLDFDVYVSNMWSSAGHRIVPLVEGQVSPQTYHALVGAASGNTLCLREGPGRWREAAHDLGLDAAGWAWGQAVADFDNDADLDVYVVNGMTSHSRSRKHDF